MSLSALAACNDDPSAEDTVDASAGSETDAAAEPDAEPAQDGGAPAEDAGEPSAPPGTLVTVGATSGHDRFYGVTYDAEGRIVAVGQTSDSADTTANFSLLVARFLADGTKDESFGEGGLVTVDLVEGGSVENARSVALQSDGKIVVGGNVDHDPSAAGVLARDADWVLVRLSADGKLDTSFGDEGVARFDLGTGVETEGTSGPTLSGADALWSVGVTADDALILHGATRATGVKTRDGTPRTDTDFTLVKLTKDGALDTGWATDGKLTLDLGEVNNSARAATVLADGSVVAAGYANTTLLGSGATTQPVLYKVTPSGQLDASFASEDATETPGVFYDYVTEPGLTAEAYGAVRQGEHWVTLGYGATNGAGTGTDLIFCRFSADGAHDLTFGTDGLTYVDVGGYSDNGRTLVELPDGRILGIGGGRPTPETAPEGDAQPPADGLLVLLEENGALDGSFGTDGIALYDFGGPNDFFWGGALSPDGKSVAVVGIASSAEEGGADEAALVILKP